MLRDVFYYGKKPNAHPREKFASNIDDARQQSTTEHFWIINEFCDYTNFDWDWDFDFLADDDVWAEEHNNVWPSPYQKDSGTWLCSEQDSQVIVYRADVEPIKLKDTISNNWKIIESIDKSSFDFKWHPDPTEDPYIYVFGNQWYSGTIMPTVEYHVPGATDRKYIVDKIAQLLPMPELFNTIIQTVDFDYSWRPDPTSPPYIYVFGNSQYPATVMPTIEFHVDSAVERKYIENILPKLKPQQDKFNILEIIDRTKFDFSWVPDPTSPPYIYVFGNTQYPGNIMPTVEYTVEGATERKYIDDVVAHMLPIQSLFNTIHETLDFDYSWRPDPTSPPYIYVFGNSQYPATVMPTVEFHVEGATERKYIDDIVPTLAHQPHNFELLEDIDTATFDFSWVPDPTSPPYIYAWGNQWNKPEDKISVQYVVEGATEYKYMDQQSTRKACTDNWQTPGYVIQSSFDYSWEPNPNDPPYIYVFGTTHQKTGGPRYVVEGATEIKYMDLLKAQVIPWQFKNWKVPRNVDQTEFDFSWHPDDTEPNFIYQFPSQWSRTGGPRFVMPDATEVKYVCSPIAVAKKDMTHWSIPDIIDTSDFDFSWHPDVEDKPYIYQFGTQWQKTNGPIFTAPGCTEESEIKYIDILKAKSLPTTNNWIMYEDILDFDYSWHPDDTEHPYIYQWGNKHYSSTLKPTVEYVVSGATDIKHMSQDVTLKVSDNWIEHYDIDKTKFDMSWRPDPTSPPYIYIWGNKHIAPELKSTLEYRVEGATEIKYMPDLLEVLPEFDRWNEIHRVNRTKFDLTWRPDPREPAYIYVWGNKWIPGELESTIEYHCPEATEKKYMESLVDILPQQERWNTIQQTVNFDYSWRPDPREPAYIYVWGNKWIPGELKPTVEYYCPNATERKYMGEVEVAPEMDRWNIVQDVADTFDLTWRPDPREPAYIYVWGNKYITGELKSTIEYHCPNATEKKHMGDADVIPEYTKWKITQDIDKTKFDMLWRPDPREPAYIYVWGNQHIDAELKPTIEYYCEGATERKYMGNVEVLPEFDKWVEVQSVDRTKFDLTWRPDPREPAYIYTWGNKHISAELKPTIEYHCQGATERKYMGNADVIPDNNWSILLAVDNSFDFTWRPDPREPAFVYVWGNQHNRGEIEPTVEYHTAGATERKYMDDPVTILPDYKNWTETQLVDRTKFDFSWRPDPTSPPYIYTWGNKHISAELKPTIEYHCQGATEYKYMGNADVIPDKNWSILLAVDNSFDFTWRPDPREPAFVYVWGNQHNRGEIEPTVIYTTPGATERKYMDDPVTVLPDYNHWTETQPVNRDKFDFSWRPDPTSPPYIYTWGNKHISAELKPTVEYHTPGATERKYMGNADVIPDKNWSILLAVDNNFDFTWRPDPREPAYIYVWGNQHNRGEIEPTIEYHTLGATERKYMDDPVSVLPDYKNWTETQPVDRDKFDFSWRPDPTSPPYIYTWGNKHISAELKPTVEYRTPGATEYKYMGNADVIPDNNWSILLAVDNSFDFTWRPDPREPAYIYVWGNQHNRGEIEPTVIYTTPGATERKYMDDPISVLPDYENWTETQLVDRDKFDFSWRPDPGSPPYIYVWGNKHISAELKPTVTYTVPSATEYKYMGNADVIPDNNWSILLAVDNSFDFTWRPDPREPAFIYVWGNQHNRGEIEPTVIYTVPGATETKFMSEPITVLPDYKNWTETQPVNRTKFDFSWRPNPSSPPYIYVWGNKYIPAELKPTLTYTVPGAIEYKYFQEPIEVLPETDRWNILQEPDNFDFTWRPDPREPAYIYVWGNKHISGELKSTIEYHCPNGTERKYVGNIDVKPEWDRYQVLIPVDKTSFDFTWRPDPREPAYIYVWGNQSNSAEKEPTIEYHCEGATERKYITDTFVKTLPVVENWKILIPVDNFDYSWRPDPHSPPYIYVFGNQWHDATTEPTLEYHVESATERKFITDVIPNVTRTQENWQTLIPVESFDYSWRPNPHSAPYIYVFGNQWHDSIKEPTIEYYVPGATTKKYVDDIHAMVKSTATESLWKRLIPIESFDYSWRPDPHSPPFIYIFGNKWNDATTEPSIEYRVEGATEYKYVEEPIATPQANLSFWSINNNDDLDTFDFTWRPNPHSPAQIYQWADNGPRYTMPGATEVVFMERTVETRKAVVNRYKIKTTIEDLIAEHSDEVFWAINPDLSYDKFDFSWRPNEENFRHINVFGNEYSKNTQTYYINGPLYNMGHREFNYVEEQSVKVDSNLSMFFIDRSNSESAQRFEELRTRYPNLQKTRYLNSWVDTINRCVAKSNTNLFWVLNSELDYSEFEFDFYPSPWQQRMIHVFGTQWSHWGTTFMVNKEAFPEDTKYVKIIEHLNMLNFVKSKKAKAINVLYDIVYIDHGNMDPADHEGKTVIKYNNSYLKTFKKLLEQLPTKNEHYIWVASSVCDYSKFDFTYICDPYAREQLHVFPSDKQKFGDTFLVNVNKLRALINDMLTLEDYGKINYNQHQRANRLPAPIIITTDDTHCESIQQDFDFPYAIFTTNDNSNLVVNDIEPMSLWSPNTKNIIITASGGTRIVVPKEAKSYITEELYDYPYITKTKNIAKSKPLDIVFLSNGETGADENYKHLLKVTKGLPNRVVRVDGVNGRVAAYHAAAEASETPWMFTVFAKLCVDKGFDWTWQPDRLQIPKHYIFNAINPVNGLEYGHQAMIAYNKKITLSNTGKGLDFTLDDEHEVIDMNSGVAMFNTDEWSTWRTSFREAIKLCADDTQASKDRLNVWLTVGKGSFAQYSINGAKDAVEYFEQVNGELDKLRLSYDWPWLKKYFNTKYN
jgi:hypothetical protein